MPVEPAAVRALAAAVGWVGAPLLACSLALWFVATLRLLDLRRGFSGPVQPHVWEALKSPAGLIPAHGAANRYLRQARSALQRPETCQHHLRLFLDVERERVGRHAPLLMGLVTVAPLLGLFGTVTGMIETFSSMQAGPLAGVMEPTMARGVSAAMISTQLGLVIGIPGLAAARLLARLESKRTRELLQTHGVLVRLRKVPP